MRTDIEPEGIPTELPLAAIRVETLDDYEQATARVAQLSGAQKGTSEERELKALTAAIMAWDQRHDEATCWE